MLNKQCGFCSHGVVQVQSQPRFQAQPWLQQVQVLRGFWSKDYFTFVESDLGHSEAQDETWVQCHPVYQHFPVPCWYSTSTSHF